MRYLKRVNYFFIFSITEIFNSRAPFPPTKHEQHETPFEISQNANTMKAYLIADIHISFGKFPKKVTTAAATFLKSDLSSPRARKVLLPVNTSMRIIPTLHRSLLSVARCPSPSRISGDMYSIVPRMRSLRCALMERLRERLKSMRWRWRLGSESRWVFSPEEIWPTSWTIEGVSKTILARNR
jgi:hypothetical protein